MSTEEPLARALLGAFRPEFAEREATSIQLAGLILDAVSAALPLTRHEPADGALAELELLAQDSDVYAWDGAPGWDVVLARGLAPRPPLPPGPPVLEGIGARPERTQQRGELKRRAHAEAERLVALARQSAQRASGSVGSQPKWQPSTTSCSGSSLARARTAVDFPVPFSPRISTPPMVGTIAFRIRASFIDSWPTIAVKG